MNPGHRALIFPAWRDNPYLNLLALSARAGGWSVLESTTFDGLIGQSRRLVHGDVLHVHWTSPIAQTAPDDQGASQRVQELERMLAALQRRGVRLVWTLHNRLPHELAHRDAEIELYRLLARRADAIHIMSEATPDVVADICTLDPARTRLIPHPSYEGVYDSTITRSEARASFDLPDDAFAVLFLGQLRPYKGIDLLLEAVASAPVRSDGRPLTLMLAGSADEDAQQAIQRGLAPDVRSIVEFGFVPDGDIARWYRAADISVLPYRAILNSGSAHLAASFRVPVLLPAEPHLRSQFATQPWVRFFDTSRSAASIAETLADPDAFAGLTDADFHAFTHPISPWRTARQYRALLDELAAA